MTHTLPISKAREDLPTLVDRASRMLDEYTITVNGSPAAVLMSATEYASWKETMDILSDTSLVKAIQQGEKDIAKNRVYNWDKIKKDLGIHV